MCATDFPMSLYEFYKIDIGWIEVADVTGQFDLHLMTNDVLHLLLTVIRGST